MSSVAVSWVAGVWFVEQGGQSQSIADERQLSAWLADRSLTREDLEFPSTSLRERFIHDFGPLESRPR